MSARYHTIEETLRRARAALRREDGLVAVAWVALGVGSALLLAFVLAAAGLATGAVRPWYLGAAAATVLVAFGLALRPFLRRLTDDELARRIGATDGGIGEGLLSAVQLHRDAPRLSREYAISAELIERHVDVTAGATEAFDARRLADRERTRKLAAMGGAALGSWLVASLLFPGIAARSRALLLGLPAGMHVPSLAPTAAGAAPRLGDVTVTYRFPAYTGRDNETQEGTDGSLKALKGTVAEVRLKADRPVKHAKVLLNGKDELPVESLENAALPGGTSGTSSLLAEIPILENGSWTIEAAGADGARAASDAIRTITVVEDEVPTAQIVWPASESLEVNELEDVDLVWGAEDDFGLREVALVWENHPPTGEDAPVKPEDRKATSGRIPLANFSRENPLRHGDRMRWSLAKLGLQAGGYVEYWIEATDTDTISGPKKGRSGKYRLYLLSSSQIHDKVVAMQEALLKGMVHYLADHLELEPKNVARERVHDESERLEGKARELVRSIDRVSAEMLKDPLGEEHVYDQLRKIREDMGRIADDYTARSIGISARAGGDGGLARHAAFSRAHRDAIPVIEKDILFLDKLIEKQRFDGARDELQKLVAEQKDLKSMLEEYKKGGMADSEMAKALEKKLAELERRMAEVAQKMASTMKSMPTDFDNSAMQEDALAQIRKALEEGRFDDAAALTEKMLESLDQMVSQMNEVEDEFNMDPELARQFAETGKELGDLAEKQQQVLDETNRLREGIQKRVDQDGNRIQEFAKKELEKVKELKAELEKLETRGQLDPWMRAIVRSAKMGMDRDVNALEGGLKSGELGEALSHASDIESTLEGVREAGESMQASAGGEGADPRTVQQAAKAREKAQEIVDDLEKLRASFEDSATPGEKQKLSQLGERQQQLQQRAQQLAEKMGQMSEQTPFMPGEAGKAVQGAAGAMGEAAGKLKGGNAAGAMPSERQAQAQLGEAQQRMQGSGGGRGGRGGLPLAQRMGGMRRGPEGNSGFNNEDVEIPDGSQFRVPKEFREDILEAMKKPSPDGYKQLNQDYYESLIK